MAKEGWEAWQPGSRPALPGLAKVVGHRGARARAPENTLAGLRKAAELGASWVEFDVMLTSDGVPVLMHDDTLERTTDGQGSMAAITLADLRQLDAGSSFGPEYAKEPVPTFAETIALLGKLGVSANVEIKPVPGFEIATAQAVVRMLQEDWPFDSLDLLISSFSLEALRAARQAAPDLSYGLLVEDLPVDWPDLMQQLGCTSLHPSHERVTPATVAEIDALGVPVLLYTVNDVERAKAYIEAGAAAIITDVPDLVLPLTTQR